MELVFKIRLKNGAMFFLIEFKILLLQKEQLRLNDAYKTNNNVSSTLGTGQ